MTENRRMFTSIDNEGSECDKITFGDNNKGKVKGLGKILEVIMALSSRILELKIIVMKRESNMKERIRL
jgi:hypothetical protein